METLLRFATELQKGEKHIIHVICFLYIIIGLGLFSFGDVRIRIFRFKSNRIVVTSESSPPFRSIGFTNLRVLFHPYVPIVLLNIVKIESELHLESHFVVIFYIHSCTPAFIIALHFRAVQDIERRFFCLLVLPLQIIIRKTNCSFNNLWISLIEIRWLWFKWKTVAASHS